MAATRTVFLLQLLLLQHLVLTSSFVVSGHHRHLHHSLLKDKAALLAFRKTIVFDPNSRLANWIGAVEVCNFTGVTCDRRHHHRVVKLNLTSSELTGPLSPIISNLTGLRVLNLIENNFFGIIPPELSSLRHLRHLQLDMNNLQGSLPKSFALLSKLTLITIMDNKLTGELPPTLFSNCTSLGNVDLSYNFLTGKIPQEIGNCPHLWTINLYNNQFTGELPVSLTNISVDLYNIDVEYNHLSGELPANIIGKLQALGFLHLSYNHMYSHNKNTNLEPFFNALGNCTDLEELELAGMGLGGSMPSSIGQLSTTMHSLVLQENQIYGSIPSGIGNLSGLTLLNLTSNYLNGTISAKISQLLNLEQLFLSHNLFTGAIPAALGQFPKLGLIDLSNNQFSGEIPASLGNLVKVNSMFLNNNNLSGTIPPTLGQCIDLYKLDLSYNRLTGSIPPQISGLHEIRIFLNLSHNRLEGPLPIELSKLENVQEIDVSSNNLTGSIFVQMSSCIALRMINFSHNSLEGDLPVSLGDLKNLESFDVSKNHLSGTIPVSLNKIPTLTYLNLSFNNFRGAIPSGGVFDSVTYASFLENLDLCGAVPCMPACAHKRRWFRSQKFLIIFVLVILVSAFLSSVCCAIGIRRFKVIISSRNSVRSERTSKPTVPELIHNFPRITYRELSEATEGFDGQRLIGIGSYGRVYKGILPDGTPIAVKVLQFQSGNSTKSFNRECQVLKRIRHRNLIRIITACSLPDFKALVLPYMANGSLDSRLYPHSGTGLCSGSSDLTLIQRVNICSDIAEGMAYLHHHSHVKVIHCDLKPSNVLLNDDMTALVSDFGIARLVLTVGGGNAGVVENVGNSTANLLSGSIGYIAPALVL
ncbi:putative leucine-rich repeat receptor-like serine/threonine-protein kinase At2g24130 isoform X2 [Jatropha curcas]|uniref:putative leucine-rich repeat receptor-like serine/threonine-protein kinase At2g24130 isoform X2 n=1 Tax=Jatropha curcas TaxID=180498 RepID=UPI00189481C9|nr:putative leucine-rich repeat receptor-like serine/threonine-protein kinase At2g24130 isoform X2 [Jatropha curcas]